MNDSPEGPGPVQGRLEGGSHQQANEGDKHKGKDEPVGSRSDSKRAAGQTDQDTPPHKSRTMQATLVSRWHSPHEHKEAQQSQGSKRLPGCQPFKVNPPVEAEHAVALEVRRTCRQERAGTDAGDTVSGPGLWCCGAVSAVSS